MMQTLADVTFASGELPRDWVVDRRGLTFESGAWCSGRGSLVRWLLPPGRWERLRVEIDVTPRTGAALTCSDGTLTMTTDLLRGQHRVTFYGPRALARTTHTISARPGAQQVVFEIGGGGWSAAVNGETVVAAQDPSPAPLARLLNLGFYDDCLVHRVRVLADGRRDAGIAAPAAHDFHLQVAVDFVDDLIAAPFNQPMLDRLFAELRDWGVRRCQWIYYGRRSDGWWDNAGNAAAHAASTMDRIGEIFPAAVRAAHAHGIEIHALLKPFDMGFYYSYGHAMPQARTRGRLARIGGPKTWVAHFPAQHQHLLMARKPGVSGPALSEVIQRIDLVSRDAAPAGFTVDEIKLYVSDDNTTYRLYDGPIDRQETVEDYPLWEPTSSGGRPTGQARPSRVMRLTSLQIRHPYFALAVEGRSGSFGNTLINLVHVFGDQGEEQRITYGLVPRRVSHLPEVPPDGDADFTRVGVEFDAAPGTPTAVQPGHDAIGAAWAIDSGDGFLAIAMGKDVGPIAVLSPSFPAAREWWLGWLHDALDAGADGIELRVRSHNYCLTWGEFGFERPVVDAFLARYGVDLLKTDDFDRAAWRRLRGEAYTTFLREARGVADSYRKPMGLHISPTLEMDPAIGGAMDMHWDWRTWIDEGLADSITMKEVWPESRLARDVLERTRPRQIPVIFSPFALNLFHRPEGEKVVAQWMRLARENGYAGYQLYENCVVLRATPDGELVMTQPALRELFQSEFKLDQ